MKAKRRNVNTDTKLFNKKIITRNSQGKIMDGKSLSVATTCHNNSPNKPSPNTRAKCNLTGKLDFDPYLFSKLDDDCKLPMKKMKIAEKNFKDVSVNTCDFSASTDPILLGPCEPGTAIELRGIVWLETETGLLVINVTWRGRTYVGTLLDSSKYEFTPSFNSQDFPGKFESNQTNRLNRGRKRYAPAGATYHNGLRPSTTRHSRRLSESQSYQNNSKKFSSRRHSRNIDACYIDSFPLSADPSFSGESDCDLNAYQRYSQTNRTRSVTRSLAKQGKVSTSENESSSLDTDSFLKCSQTNCSKRFIDLTALTYHLQRFHGVFDDIIKTEKDDSVCVPEEPMKFECSDITSQNEINETCHLINGTTDTLFEIKCDESIENYEEKNSLRVDSLSKEGEIVNNGLLELSVNVAKLEQMLPLLQESNLPQEDLSVMDKTKSLDLLGLQPANDVLPTSTTLDLISLKTQPNQTVRTVTAPTVSVPIDVSTSLANTNSSLSPMLIKPKPRQPSDVAQNTQLKKLKPAKVYLPINNNSANSTSFQIPSTTTLSKKRPLIPHSGSQIQNIITNQIKPHVNVNITSTHHSSRNTRPSTVTGVTPILPAACNLGSVAQIMSTPTLSSVSCCSTLSNSSNNSQTTSKRAIVTSTNLSPTGITSLQSLKPIQPKPKSANILPTYSNCTTSTLFNPVPLPNMSSISPNQTNHQRQILPSPQSKTDVSIFSDEKLSQTSLSMKKKRRKSDKKLRINFHECARLKKLSLNPIQPKHGNDFKELPNKIVAINKMEDNFKREEENSHSPEYSDLSENNDTPAPILEKEIELKSIDSDKLVICTEFESVTSNNVNSSGSENFDENKDNKPPALMPAVLSTDLMNGPTVDTELCEAPVKTGRKKVQINKFCAQSIDQIKLPPLVTNDADVPACLGRHNDIITSNRRSFQSSSFGEKIPSVSVPSLKVSVYNSTSQSNLKSKFPNKCANLSAINDYVWMTKNNVDSKSKSINKCDRNVSQAKCSPIDETSKKLGIPAHLQPSNGKFTVKALTSPQEIVSRSFPNPSTAISSPVNPNTKLTSTLFKN